MCCSGSTTGSSWLLASEQTSGKDKRNESWYDAAMLRLYKPLVLTLYQVRAGQPGVIIREREREREGKKRERREISIVIVC